MQERDDDWPSASFAWLWVFVLVLAVTSSYIDRQILSLLVDPIKQDLGISDSQFSLLQGMSFALFYGIVGLPIGGLIDRYRRGRIIAFCILLWSIMTALCGLAAQYWQLFLARTGVGIGEGALSPTAYSILPDCFSRERLGRAMSVYIAGGGMGVGLAFILGGSVITFVESLGNFALPYYGLLRPWQTAFIIVASPGILIAVAAFLMREPRRKGMVDEARSQNWSEILTFLRAQAGIFLPFIFGLAGLTCISHGTFAWAPAFLMRAHGLRVGEAGTLLGFATIPAILLGLIGTALLAERLARTGMANIPFVLAAVCAALALPVAAVLAFSTSVTTGMVCIFLLILFANAPFGIGVAEIQARTPGALRGRTGAVFLLVQSGVGMVFGPLVPALFTDTLFGGVGSAAGQSLALSVALFSVLSGTLLAITVRNGRIVASG